MSNSDRIPACTRCGERQPADGRPTMEDGTPISGQEYLAVARLVADALVCGACVPALATSDHWTGIEWSFPGGVRPPETTEQLTSERVSWDDCPHCDAPAAVGWQGGTPVEFDCLSGCRITGVDLAAHFPGPTWADPSGTGPA